MHRDEQGILPPGFRTPVGPISQFGQKGIVALGKTGGLFRFRGHYGSRRPRRVQRGKSNTLGKCYQRHHGESPRFKICL
jgi:hypothetical protein